MLSVEFEDCGKEVWRRMSKFMPVLMAWDIDSFLTNLGTKLQTWGSLVFIILGVIALIVAIYKLVTGLMSHGKGQPPNWFVILLLFLVGGALVAAGTGSFDWVKGIAEGGKTTIEGLGTVSILLGL